MATTREILRQTAGMVATAMGDGWTVDTSHDYDNQILIGPDGARLLIRAAGNYGTDADKVEISGRFPEQTYRVMGNDYTVHDIKVTRDRGPDVIAREITRRLLPKYLPELARVTKRLAEHASYAANTGDNVQRLMSVAPGPYGLDDGRDGARRSFRVSVGLNLRHGYGDVTVQGDNVALDLRSLPVGLAETILRAMSDYRAE